MKTLVDQITYEDFSKQHYAPMSQTSAVEGSLHRVSTSQPSAARGTKFLPLLRSRLAYVVVVTILAALTISRVVVAMTGGSTSGGVEYLVR